MADQAGKRVLPFGSWPTPITSEVVVERAVTVNQVAVDGDDVVWSEGRPAALGRTALVRRTPDGGFEELLSDELNVRSAVHEYGGGAWWVARGTVWFANWSDQRLYRRDPASGRCEPLTPEPEIPRGERYADGTVSPDGAWLACVRERHPAHGRGSIDVKNEIVRLDAGEPSTPAVMVSGPDFVSSPRLNPDGRMLCWIEWDNPNMPWDGSRLLVRDLASGEETLVAGGEAESISEPRWGPDGSLAFISDRTGWWNLYRFSPGEGISPLVEIDADIGVPQWVFGTARYALLADGRIVYARWRNGLDGLALRRVDGSLRDLKLPFTAIRSLVAGDGSWVVAIAASMTSEAEVCRIDLDDEDAVVQTVKPARDLGALGIDPGFISVPRPIEFPSAGGRTSHALLYAPTNPSCQAPEGELPPLVVRVHGGPTSSGRAELSLDFQYLTSRGFALADVNYGGSTGYGREYRELLNGAWGVVDVEDCTAAAVHLAEQGDVDPERMVITGGSAGGYTTLMCLARPDTPFAAGGDHYGVADLEALVNDSHKFEARSLDHLVGPYPEQRRRYRERSPINHVEDLSRPLIVLQGLDDTVVPPRQATMIVEALKAKGVPVAYVAFEGEQHGVRQAANVRRALESELSFYAQVLGFELPPEEGIEPVVVAGG